MRTRVATADDVPALARLNRAVQDLHRAAMPERYTDPATEDVEAWLRDRLAEPDTVLIVADDGGRLAGYVMVKRIAATGHVFARARTTAHVDQLSVDPGAQRHGTGRALMAAAEEVARGWGAVAVTLDVQAFNDSARAFYAALGYEVATLRLARTI